MPEERMTDVERDLATLLAVDTSPGFTAAVRARIAESRAGHRWRGWALAIAAALTLIAGGWMMRTDRVVDPEPPLPGIERAARPAPRRDSVPSEARAPVPAARTEASRPERAAIRASSEPDVIVDSAFASAVRRLVRDARHGLANAELLEADARADALPPDLSVLPVSVSELTIPIITIGEPQRAERR